MDLAELAAFFRLRDERNAADTLDGDAHRAYTDQHFKDILRVIREQSWDAGWEAHRSETIHQDQDSSHAITRSNPFRGKSS